jgi:ornithine carbamoyltransferase
MTHFLDIHTTAPADLRAMIDSALAMKTARAGQPKGAPDAVLPLDGRMVALIFEKPSTRTRVSFAQGRRDATGAWRNHRRHRPRPVALCRPDHDPDV